MGRKRGRQKSQSANLAQQSLKTEVRNGISPWIKHLLVAAGLCLVTLIAYSNSFTAGLLADNHYLIGEDPRLRQANQQNIDLILNHTYWWPQPESGLYRPVTTLSYLFNYSILGNADNPAGYHWVNLILHLINILLLYGLALKLIRKFWPAVFIAALWALHPILTESVTNIIGRADLLAGLTLLSGFWMYLKSTETTGYRRAAWLAGLMIVTAIGVFSKESAVAILGVIVLYELVWWRERRQVRGLLFGCAAIAPPLLTMWYARSVVLARSPVEVFLFVDNPLLGASFLTARLTAVKVMARYLWLLVWPAGLSWDHSYRDIPFATGTVYDWLAWIAVAAVLLVSAIQYRRNRIAFFFAGFALVTIVPVSNLLLLIGTIMAERFLYLPSIGFAVCLVLAAFAVGERFRVHWLAPVALCAIAAALGVRTWERNQDWQNNLSLVTSAVRVAPNSFKTHESFASALYESDHTHANIDQVIAEEQKSLAILDPLPDSLSTAASYANAGVYYEKKGDTLIRTGPDGKLIVPPESVQAYQKSLQLLLRGVSIDKLFAERYRQKEKARGTPDSKINSVGLPELYQPLALTYLRLGQNKSAFDAAIRARDLAPHHPETYVLLGDMFNMANRQPEAATALMEALLLSGDRKILAELDQLYKRGLDTKGCAFTQTPDGPYLNSSCEIVHEEICNGSGDLLNAFHRAGRPDLADQIKKRAIEQFGCPVPAGN